MRSNVHPCPLGFTLTTLLVLGLPTGARGQEQVTRFATPNPQSTGYTIDYKALGEASGLTTAQKFQVAKALREGEGHLRNKSVEDIAGLSASCTITKVVGIPVGVDCTVSADPAATKVLAGLGTFALTNAICLVVDVEDGEITEPICDVLLEAVAATTIEPVIDQCADNGQTTSISLGFKLVPPKLHTPSASCS